LLRKLREQRNLIHTETGGHAYDESTATGLIKLEVIRQNFGVGLNKPGSRLFELGIGGGSVIVTYGFMFPGLPIYGVEESTLIYKTFIDLMGNLLQDDPTLFENVRTAGVSFLDLGDKFDSVCATNCTMYVV